MSGHNRSSLDKAIRTFEAVEANLAKLERLWEQIYGLIPGGIAFGSNNQYEELCRAYVNVLAHLPKIDDWKPATEPYDLDSIAQNRFDALEIDEISAKVSVERWVEEPGYELREYRFKLNLKRRQLIRDAVSKLFNEINVILSHLQNIYPSSVWHIEINDNVELRPLWDKVRELDTLLGSSVTRPQGWNDILKQLSFGGLSDSISTFQRDWPMLKEVLMKSLYDQNEPIPTGVNDLSEIVHQKPSGSVVTKLNWEQLGPDNFERLIYSLISCESGYENAEWLMHTNAPDRWTSVNRLDT